MTDLIFVNLPNIGYPNGGLTIEGLANVTRVQVAGCPKLDAVQLLSDIVSANGSISEISLEEKKVTGDVAILRALIASGARGFSSDLTTGCDGLSGKWILNTLIERTASLQRYGLTSHF